MSKVAVDKPADFLSTYPSDQTRIGQIKAWLPSQDRITAADEAGRTNGATQVVSAAIVSQDT
jgi:hypothetical protein